MPREQSITRLSSSKLYSHEPYAFHCAKCSGCEKTDHIKFVCEPAIHFTIFDNMLLVTVITYFHCLLLVKNRMLLMVRFSTSVQIQEVLNL